jgi:four helix bundle protein
MHYQETAIWNKSMTLAEQVCVASTQLPAMERYGIRLQLTRSAVSVASNIAEDWTRESKKEKAQFLAIAHGSLSELHTQLLICERVGWLFETDLVEIKHLIDEISRMLTVLRRGLRPTKPP